LLIPRFGAACILLHEQRKKGKGGGRGKNGEKRERKDFLCVLPRQSFVREEKEGSKKGGGAVSFGLCGYLTVRPHRGNRGEAREKKECRGKEGEELQRSVVCVPPAPQKGGKRGGGKLKGIAYDLDRLFLAEEEKSKRKKRGEKKKEEKEFRLSHRYIPRD